MLERIEEHYTQLYNQKAERPPVWPKTFLSTSIPHHIAPKKKKTVSYSFNIRRRDVDLAFDQRIFKLLRTELAASQHAPALHARRGGMTKDGIYTLVTPTRGRQVKEREARVENSTTRSKMLKDTHLFLPVGINERKRLSNFRFFKGFKDNNNNNNNNKNKNNNNNNNNNNSSSNDNKTATTTKHQQQEIKKGWRWTLRVRTMNILEY